MGDTSSGLAAGIRACSVLIGASNVAIVPAMGGYGVEDIYLREFSPQRQHSNNTYGDSPMTSVANTVAMTTLTVHTLQPLIFYTAACTLRVTVGSSYI